MTHTYISEFKTVGTGIEESVNCSSTKLRILELHQITGISWVFMDVNNPDLTKHEVFTDYDKLRIHLECNFCWAIKLGAVV